MKNKLQMFYNPFERIAGWKAFYIGLIIVCLTVLIGLFSNVCFPGVLDAKIVVNLGLIDAFIFQFIGLISLVLFFYLSSLIFAKNVRLQDILGAVLLARFPYFFVSLLGFLIQAETILLFDNAIRTGNIEDLAVVLSSFGFILVTILMIPFIIWFIVLLYNGFRVSTGLRGGKCIFVFIGSVLIAEIASLLLVFLYKYF